MKMSLMTTCSKVQAFNTVSVEGDGVRKMLERGEKELVIDDADRQIDIMRVHEKLDILQVLVYELLFRVLENEKFDKKNQNIEIKVQ